MNEHIIAKDDRKSYCDLISKVAQGCEIELEIMGLDIGDQIETDWEPFQSLTYDPKTEALSLQTRSLEHTIFSPVEIVAAEDHDILKSILIRDSEGHAQLINFRNAPRVDLIENAR